MLHCCRHSTLRLISVVLCLVCITCDAPAAEIPVRDGLRPNIVLILADDIGYGDLGCYGADRVKTPNCDQLAREGMRFTDAHATASICTPTRYALLTGQYAWRNLAGAKILDGDAPLSISPSTTTLPSLLRNAGYATGLVGKWHLGLGSGEIDWNGDIKPGPLEIGFDEAFFFPATNDRVPCVFVRNHRIAGLHPADADPLRINYKQKIGTEPTGADHPEMLKLKLLQGHDQTIVNGISRIGWMSGGKAAWWQDEDIADTLSNEAVAFIGRNRSRPFFLYFATHDIHQPRWPHSRFRGTSGCGLRGDAIQEFDFCVGKVLATLNRLHLADNTLVIVSSDNGGMMDDGYAGNDVRDANGHRCNGALRGFKGSLYEGGHREPFIARWPGHIKDGSTSQELVALVDMLATCADIVGRPLREGAGPDSFNILPALLGKKLDKPVRDHLVVQVGPRALAIRKGPWKFIPGTKGSQLYNLENDLCESRNLAASHPETVMELGKLLQQCKTSPQTRQ